MNLNDKNKYDVFAHLTDIPMLGNTYVPDLWQKIGGDNIPRPSVTIQRVQYEAPVTAQVYEVSMPSTSSASIGGGSTRTIEKRSMPTTSDAASSSSDPQAKVPRYENNWH